MIYFQYLLRSIALAYVCSYLFGKRKKMFFLVVSGILLSLFLGLRDIEVGGIDLLRYEMHYETLLHATSLISAYEVREGENVLFFISMYVSSSLGLSFQQFLFVVGVFSISASLLLYYRYSNYPLLCIAMFLPTCYIHMFSQLKQTIAVGIAALAYMLLQNNKTLWAYVVIVIAILFHPTALVMVPFFILCKYRANPLLLIFLFACSFFVYLLRMEIGHFLTLAFYSQYLGNWESRESITGMASLFIILTISYLIMMPKRKYVCDEKYLIISSYLYVLILAMTIFFCASYSFAFTRLNNYYMMFVPLALSTITEFDIWKSWSKYPVYAVYGIIIYIMINWFLDLVVSQQLYVYKFYWM